MNESIVVRDLSNRNFLGSHAQTGWVGLVGGTTLIEKVIRKAELHTSHRTPEDISWTPVLHAIYLLER